MTKEYSNEEFGFGSSAYAEPVAKKEEDKIARSSSTPAKIQQAAVTAVAPAVESAPVAAPAAVAAVLPPLPTASAGAPPAIQNPVQSADFWSSALKGVGLPLAAGAGLGLLGGAAYSKLKGGGGGGGGNAAAVPAVDEELRQIRLAQEQAKLDSLLEKQYRQRELHEANLAKLQPAAQAPAPTTPVAEAGLPSTNQQFSVQQKPVDYSLNAPSAYGEQKLNAPTGAPNVAVAPPAEVAPAPVQPKPVSELEQLRIQKAQFDLEAARAKEARAAEAHASRLAADAKRAEAKAQTKTASGALTPETQQMLANSERAKAEKAIIANQKATAVKTAPPAASVVPPAVAAPTAEVAPVATAPAAPAAPKGAKWPGGAEGSAVQLFGGTKKNFTPESQAAVEMFKDFVGGPLSMPPTGGSINQIPEASKFYEKHTGEPLPRNAEGKLTRIPEEQMQKLHAGIRTELEEAVKGNKLGTLGKGAMAAAALLGLSTAVQAAQKGDFGPLRQAGFDIGGPVALGKLGIAALSRAAGTGFSAATYAGDLNEGEQQELARRRHDYMMKESQKLGSPLRSVPPPR